MREITLNSPQFNEMAAEVLSQGGSIRFQAHGGSMYPFIRNGAVLTVEPAEPQRLNIGDVVLYHGSNGLAVHRIVGTRMDHSKTDWLIRGDNVLGSPEMVSATSVIGRVVHVEHGARGIRLDSKFRQWTGIAWARLAPLGQLLLRGLALCKRALSKK